MEYVYTDGNTKKSEKELASETEALREENNSLKNEYESCRQAIEQLRVEQGYLSDVADEMQNAAVIVDPDDRIRYVNREAKKLLKGGGARDYINERLCDIPPLSDSEKFLEKYPRALSDRKDVKFLLYLMPRRWYEVSVHPIGSNTLIFFRDITIRHVTDELYKLTHFSINNIREAAIWIKTGGRIFYVNHAAAELLGYPRDELVKMTFADHVTHLPADGWQGFWDLVKKSESTIFESGIRRNTGYVCPVEISANFIKFDAQEVMALLIRDITERKQAELELIKSREQTEAAKEQAELYLDLMGHDINNMNQIGIGFLELALESPDLTPELREMLMKPFQTLQNSSRLIENVRKLQRAREGKMDISVTCLEELMDEIKTHYAWPPGRNITINLAGKQKCKVIANDLLNDVFTNLIGNAVKHNEGDLTIDIDLGMRKIDEQDFCIITISDNGHGIPDQQKQTLFSRAGKSEYKTKGSGLGLHLVKTLVESYGGKIWVRDRVPGDYTKGARFIVIIPSAR